MWTDIAQWGFIFLLGLKVISDNANRHEMFRAVWKELRSREADDAE